jgi:hypothetical protein
MVPLEIIDHAYILIDKQWSTDKKFTCLSLIQMLLYGHSHERPPLLSGQISDVLKYY